MNVRRDQLQPEKITAQGRFDLSAEILPHLGANLVSLQVEGREFSINGLSVFTVCFYLYSIITWDREKIVHEVAPLCNQKLPQLATNFFTDSGMTEKGCVLCL